MSLRKTILSIALAITAVAPELKPSTATDSPQPTAKRLREKGWWPTRLDSVRKEYAGADTCAKCHAKEFAGQQQTSMARAGWRAADTPLLRNNAKLAASMPPFTTLISRDRKGSTYTTTRGGEAMQGQLTWSFGDGVLGETFILQTGNSLYESQLSYFSATHGLDLTPGHSRAAPQNLEQAFGASQSVATAAQCFACHTTESSIRGEFDPSHAVPGVTCENCHGPGSKHVALMEQGKFDDGIKAILNPASFDPVKQVDYCGACHRAPLDVAADKLFVPINVRYQPYRLSKSRCWTTPDRRLTCTACHDPHEQVVRDTTYYDARCLACHASKEGVPKVSADVKACPVSSTRCTSCHMPKYEVPQMHGSFTDHYIRIMRAGEPYPI